MSENEINQVEEEQDDAQGVDELSDDDLDNVAGGWSGDDGGG